MNCDEFLKRLSESPAADKQLLAHAATCSGCGTILEGPPLGSPRPELADAVRSSLRAELAPVRPVASDRVLAGGLLILIAAAVAVGARGGVHSHAGLSAVTWVALYSLLGVAAAGAAIALPTLLRPGSRSSRGGLLAVSGLCVFGAIAAISLQEMPRASWFRSGVACLTMGTAWGSLTGLGVWAILRRGFWREKRAGALAGLLAGVAGLAALTMHCAILDRAHVLVWHAAVPLVLSAAGVLFVKLRN